MPDQGGGDLFGLATERFVKRRDAVGVRGVDVGTVGDEELDSGGVRVRGGPVEEGVAAGASVNRIGVDAARELGIYSNHFKSFQKYLGDTAPLALFARPSYIPGGRRAPRWTLPRLALWNRRRPAAWRDQLRRGDVRPWWDLTRTGQRPCEGATYSFTSNLS